MMSRALAIALYLLLATCATQLAAADRLRLIIETDAGGDPDDEQSLVRFLLYANEWDVEGIIANREEARDGENLNAERTGLAIVQRQIKAYGACYDKLKLHDARFPTADELMKRTVAGYDQIDDGVKLVIEAIDRDDPRPVWFLNWGTDFGAAESCLKRALDRVLAERGPEAYACFKRKLRLSSDDQFDDHTTKIEPPFPLWVDTFRPPRDGKRWYHRFSELTWNAGGFDVERDVRTGHGLLGELYPTNTTHKQKEGDSPTFIYLIPTGLCNPENPGWGGWPGRYGPREEFSGKPYYWANREDAWQGKTNRDNTLARWATAIQNDFAARMDWCVSDFQDANHPPEVRVALGPIREVDPGQRLTFDAGATTDPDRDELQFAWFFYPESSGYSGPLPAIEGNTTKVASYIVPMPERDDPDVLHMILAVTDRGQPPLTRYSRQIVRIRKKEP
jgi:hypothetical protein